MTCMAEYTSGGRIIGTLAGALVAGLGDLTTPD